MRKNKPFESNLINSTLHGKKINFTHFCLHKAFLKYHLFSHTLSEPIFLLIIINPPASIESTLYTNYNPQNIILSISCSGEAIHFIKKLIEQQSRDNNCKTTNLDQSFPIFIIFLLTFHHQLTINR